MDLFWLHFAKFKIKQNTKTSKNPNLNHHLSKPML